MYTFMNKADYQKLVLLKHIVHAAPESTLADLCQQMNLSQRTIERYLKEIETDCQEISELESFTFEKKNNYITTSFPNKLSPQYVSDRLNAEYIIKTVEFSILRNLLLKKFSSINELADALFISPSSLYRLLYKLEPVIQKFDMSFSFFDNTSDLNFIYDEKKLRFFFYYFYWTALKGIPIEPMEEHKELISEIDDTINLEHFNTLLPSKKAQIRYLCAITSIRMNMTEQVIDIPKDLVSIAKIFTDVNDLSHSLNTLHDLPNNHSEKLFFNLFARCIIGEVDSFSHKKEIFNALSEKNLPLVNDCHNLLKSFEQYTNIKLSEEDYITFFYYFLETLIFIDYFKVSFPPEFKRIPYLEIFNKESKHSNNTILKSVQEFYNDFQFSIKVPANNDQIIIAILCSIIEIQDNQPLKIAVQYSKNTSGAFLIRKKIQKFFPNDIFLFTDDYSQVDIVISDCFEPTDKKIEHFFYMDYLDDELRWYSLFDYLTQILKDLNFSI